MTLISAILLLIVCAALLLAGCVLFVVAHVLRASASPDDDAYARALRGRRQVRVSSAVA